MLSEALNVDLQPSPTMAIFGIADKRHTTLMKRSKTVIAFMMLLARRRLLLHWKSKNLPNVSMWFINLAQFIQLEKIRSTLRNKLFCLGSSVDVLRNPSNFADLGIIWESSYLCLYDGC